MRSSVLPFAYFTHFSNTHRRNTNKTLIIISLQFSSEFILLKEYFFLFDNIFTLDLKLP